MQLVCERAAEVAALADVLRPAVFRSVGKECLACRACLVPVVCPVCHRIHVFHEPAVLVVHGEVSSGQFHFLLSGKDLRFGVPSAASGRPHLVRVVRSGEKYDARVVRKAQSEQACQPFLVSTRACFGIGHVADGVFLFQFHVHHKILLPGSLVDHLAQRYFLFVELQFVNHIVRQIVQHDAVVALEEVLSVQCKVVHFTPVHVYRAVVVQFRSRHIGHQRVQHGTFGNLERPCVHHKGVALVGQLHPGGRYGQFVHCGLLHLPLHEEFGKTVGCQSAGSLHIQTLYHGLIVGMLGSHRECLWLPFHDDVPHPSVVRCVSPLGSHGVYEDTA